MDEKSNWSNVANGNNIQTTGAILFHRGVSRENLRLLESSLHEVGSVIVSCFGTPKFQKYQKFEFIYATKSEKPYLRVKEDEIHFFFQRLFSRRIEVLNDEFSWV